MLQSLDFYAVGMDYSIFLSISAPPSRSSLLMLMQRTESFLLERVRGFRHSTVVEGCGRRTLTGEGEALEQAGGSLRYAVVAVSVAEVSWLAIRVVFERKH